MPGDGSTRFASRVLLYDRTGRVLLFLDEFPDMPGQGKWITPGGGAEVGETSHETAVRELFEETGLLVPDLGPVVHAVTFEVDRPSSVHSFSHWDFYVHVVDEPFEPSREHWTVDELVTVQDQGWLTADELAGKPEGWSPFDLPELIKRFRPS
jgi:8-oxo-dGTP pyrophosphatase MutT (NUDIX family)